MKADDVLVLAAALMIDFLVGDPPNRWHPVAWLGRLIDLQFGRTPSGDRRQFAYGTVMVLLTVGVLAAIVYFGLIRVTEFGSIAYVIVGALILKMSFSFRGLRSSALKVRQCLAANNLPASREGVAMLVGRDVSSLDSRLVVSAAVESVAENSCDSFVAPLFYFAVFGIPGAVAYRVVNTYDSMIGYHGDFEYLGKFAARLDDFANYLPARITGLLIVAASILAKANPGSAWRIMQRDHGLTDSPNAGWPMSAAAGSLEIRLDNPGRYVLGDSVRTLSPDMIDNSLGLLTATVILWSIVCLIAVGVKFAATV
jgi:adenosylcobinamide-phosphate synthase